jgi:hypothetical protein
MLQCGVLISETCVRNCFCRERNSSLMYQVTLKLQKPGTAENDRLLILPTASDYLHK